jgi:hypothetical protein
MRNKSALSGGLDLVSKGRQKPSRRQLHDVDVKTRENVRIGTINCARVGTFFERMRALLLYYILKLILCFVCMNIYLPEASGVTGKCERNPGTRDRLCNKNMNYLYIHIPFTILIIILVV